MAPRERSAFIAKALGRALRDDGRRESLESASRAVTDTWHAWDARIRALRHTGDVPVTSAINVEEIVRGLRSSEVSTAALVFDGLPVVPIGRVEGEQAGAWRRAFATRSVALGQADCLIAAAADQRPPDLPRAIRRTSR